MRFLIFLFKEGNLLLKRENPFFIYDMKAIQSFNGN